MGAAGPGAGASKVLALHGELDFALMARAHVLTLRKTRDDFRWASLSLFSRRGLVDSGERLLSLSPVGDREAVSSPKMYVATVVTRRFRWKCPPKGRCLVYFLL